MTKQSQKRKLDDIASWTTRRCRLCHKIKPIHEFLTERPTANEIFSTSCADCEVGELEKIRKLNKKKQQELLDTTGRIEPLHECIYCGWCDFGVNKVSCPICRHRFFMHQLPTKEEIKQRCEAIREKWDASRLQEARGRTGAEFSITPTPYFGEYMDGRVLRKSLGS